MRIRALHIHVRELEVDDLELLLVGALTGVLDAQIDRSAADFRQRRIRPVHVFETARSGFSRCTLMTLSRAAPCSVSSGCHGIVTKNDAFRARVESTTM